MKILWNKDSRERFTINFPILKTEKTDDGRLMIEGIATSEALDQANEIVDYNSAKAAFGDWKGNIREQHDEKKAVGRAIQVLTDDDAKQIHVKAFISKGAQDTQAKILDGTLTGFSIGGSIASRKTEKVTKADGAEADATRLIVKQISETSVVDAGCNPETAFTIVKMSGSHLVGVGVDGEGDAKTAALGAGSGGDPDPAADAANKAAIDELADLLDKGAILPAELVAFAKAKRREDVSDADKKAATDKYGDVDFADEANKKYPIDTEEHIRAAWNYINREKDAAKYSAAEVKEIKGKIVAAWKKKIDKDGPPSAKEQKARVVSDLKKVLRKYMGEEAWDASTAISALNMIYNLLAGELSEDEQEPDQIEALQEAVQRLKDFIASEIQEKDPAAQPGMEVAMAAQAAGLAKITKSLGIRDAVTLDEVVAKAESMFGSAMVIHGAAPRYQDFLKAVGAAPGDDVIAKAIALAAERDELLALKADWVNAPAAAKGILKVISKGDDYVPAAGKEVTPIKKGDGKVDEAATAIKKLHSTGGQPFFG